MHGLEQIVAMNAKAGQSTSVDLSAFTPWGVEYGSTEDALGYRAVNADTHARGPVFATYDQALADMIARHAGHEDPKHLGFAPVAATAGA